MICVNRSLHGGSHAFKDELYHNQQPSVLVESGMPAASEVGQGSRAALHRGGGAGDRASSHGAIDFHLGRVLRSGLGSLQPCGPDGLGRWVAQDTGRAGTPTQRGPGRPSAASDASSGVGSSDRLAPGPVLREAAEKPERNLLRSAETGHDQVPRLRVGMHCGVRASLYAGADVGATARIDGQGTSPTVGANSQNWPENTLFAAGSRVFQYRGNDTAARGEAAVSDAREVLGTTSPKREQTKRPAHDETEARGLVFAYHGRQEARSEDFHLRGIPSLSESENRQTTRSEAALCRLARPWDSHRDPRTLPQTIWHRNQLSPTATRTNLHLRAQSPPEAVLHRRGIHLAQCVGLDSSDATCRRLRRHHDTPP